jgi:putative protease
LLKPELLAPAGDLEKLKIAVLYGADAVYLGGEDFGLRAAAAKFTPEIMREGLSFAHGRGVKVYVTVNIFAHNHDLDRMADYLKDLAAMGVDGVIVADPGVVDLALSEAPGLPVHLSTQANTTNWRSAAFWQSRGVKRVVLARELSLQEIRDIRARVNVELEVFVHGAMCIAYSGRCLLSSYMTGRDANRGDCAQACRWKYALVEEKRPGQYFPIGSDERGTYILSSRDLCLLDYLPGLVEAGVSSFKIEGRVKSLHYVATITSVYRAAIDALYNGAAEYRIDPAWREEIGKVSNRHYCDGFITELNRPKTPASVGGGFQRAVKSSMDSANIQRGLNPPLNEVSFNKGHPTGGEPSDLGIYSRSYTFVGLVREYLPEEAKILVEQRNHFAVGDHLEALTPEGKLFNFRVGEIVDQEGRSVNAAPHPQQLVSLPVQRPLPMYSMLRRAGPQVALPGK